MRSKDNRTNAFSQRSLPNRDYRRGTFLRTAAAADAFFQIDYGCNAACDLNGGFRADLDAAAAVAAGAGGPGGGSYDAIILDAHGNSSLFLKINWPEWLYLTWFKYDVQIFKPLLLHWNVYSKLGTVFISFRYCSFLNIWKKKLVLYRKIDYNMEHVTNNLCTYSSAG